MNMLKDPCWDRWLNLPALLSSNETLSRRVTAENIIKRARSLVFGKFTCIRKGMISAKIVSTPTYQSTLICKTTFKFLHNFTKHWLHNLKKWEIMISPVISFSCSIIRQCMRWGVVIHRVGWKSDQWLLQWGFLPVSCQKESDGLTHSETEMLPTNDGNDNPLEILRQYRFKKTQRKWTEKNSLTASLRSWWRSPLKDCSLVGGVREKEFMKGSEFLRTKCFPRVTGFKFPPNFHDPTPPPCFQSQ